MAVLGGGCYVEEGRKRPLAPTLALGDSRKDGIGEEQSYRHHSDAGGRKEGESKDKGRRVRSNTTWHSAAEEKEVKEGRATVAASATKGKAGMTTAAGGGKGAGILL